MSLDVINNAILLGKTIRKTRKSQGLTQQELAGACGTGVRFISELEAGKPTCHIGKVFRVLEMLGIQVILRGRLPA